MLNKEDRHLEDIVESIEYQEVTDTITICIVTLKNEHSVVGTYNDYMRLYEQEICNHYAYRDAIDKVAELEYYANKKLHEMACSQPDHTGNVIHIEKLVVKVKNK